MSDRNNLSAHSLAPPNRSTHQTVIGLTGNLGAGKSTVARIMESLGAHILDADSIGHRLLEPNSPIYQELIDEFGSSIVISDRMHSENAMNRTTGIDRKVLGRMVFQSPERLRRLNEIIHPRLIQCIQESVQQFRTSIEPGTLVVDAALIYEWGIQNLFDSVVVVTAPKEERKKRFLALRDLSADDFERRDASQIPEADKARQADAIFENTGDLETLQRQVERFFQS